MSRLTVDLTVQTADIGSGAVSVVPGASVTAYHRNSDGSQGSESTLYAGPTGSTALTQPVLSDLQGRIPGWLNPGDYLISVTGAGYSTYALPYSVPSLTPVVAVTALTGLTESVETPVSLNMPGIGCLLYSFEASVASRTRVYSTAAQATADISRNQSTDPTGNAGCLLEMVIISDTAAAPWQLSPEVGITEQDDSPSLVFPGTVRCDDPSGDMTITVYGHLLEP